MSVDEEELVSRFCSRKREASSNLSGESGTSEIDSIGVM